MVESHLIRRDPGTSCEFDLAGSVPIEIGRNGVWANRFHRVPPEFGVISLKR
jgi:hypothetical protein